MKFSKRFHELVCHERRGPFSIVVVGKLLPKCVPGEPGILRRGFVESTLSASHRFRGFHDLQEYRNLCILASFAHTLFLCNFVILAKGKGA